MKDNRLVKAAKMAWEENRAIIIVVVALTAIVVGAFMYG